jgi:hypothetical protein
MILCLILGIWSLDTNKIIRSIDLQYHVYDSVLGVLEENVVMTRTAISILMIWG